MNINLKKYGEINLKKYKILEEPIKMNKITDPQVLHDEFVKIGFKETTYDELKSGIIMELNAIKILDGR